MKKFSLRSAAQPLAFMLVLIPAVSQAADTGQLWEMTIQMNVAGMPAGMMQPRTQQVCQAKDFRNAHASDNKSKCTISNLKETPSRVTYDIRCEGKPPTTGKAEFNFEQNRQKVNGTMRMSSSDGDMTMKMSGRNLGSACDPQEAGQKRDAQMAATKKQMDGIQRQADDAHIKACTDGLQKMDPGSFGVMGMCSKNNDQQCTGMMRSLSPAVKSACSEKIGQFCSRFQTRDGLEKVGALGGSQEASRMCGVPLEKVQAQVCPGAVKDNALVFIARNCPVEAKAIAQKQCAGRSFTSMDEKYGQFCGAYRGTLTAGEREGRSGGTAARAKPASQPAPAAEAAKAPASTPTDSVKEGIGKLKGLFGR